MWQQPSDAQQTPGSTGPSEPHATGRTPLGGLTPNEFGALLPSRQYLVIRRGIELLFTLLLLPVLLPILAVLAIMVRLDRPGPILFTQMRVGRRGRRFRMYKFRTMYADSQGPSFTATEGERICQADEFFRRLEIDLRPGGNRAYYSNFGTSVEIAAPGGDTSLPAPAGATSGGILSTLNAGLTSPTTDTYAYYQGTSMATPHVSGVAALIKSVDPAATPAQVLSFIQGNVTPFPVGSTCTTALCGPGILNAAGAVSAAAAAYGPRVLGACDSTVAIPLAGAISSLNVSVTASVLLFEAVRQRYLALRAMESRLLSELAGRANTVVHDEGHAGFFQKLRADQAQHHVAGITRGARNDDADIALRVGLGLCLRQR